MITTAEHLLDGTPEKRPKHYQEHIRLSQEQIWPQELLHHGV